MLVIWSPNGTAAMAAAGRLLESSGKEPEIGESLIFAISCLGSRSKGGRIRASWRCGEEVRCGSCIGDCGSAEMAVCDSDSGVDAISTM